MTGSAWFGNSDTYQWLINDEGHLCQWASDKKKNEPEADLLAEGEQPRKSRPEVGRSDKFKYLTYQKGIHDLTECYLSPSRIVGLNVDKPHRIFLKSRRGQNTVASRDFTDEEYEQWDAMSYNSTKHKDTVYTYAEAKYKMAHVICFGLPAEGKLWGEGMTEVEKQAPRYLDIDLGIPMDLNQYDIVHNVRGNPGNTGSSIFRVSLKHSRSWSDYKSREFNGEEFEQFKLLGKSEDMGAGWAKYWQAKAIYYGLPAMPRPAVDGIPINPSKYNTHIIDGMSDIATVTLPNTGDKMIGYTQMKKPADDEPDKPKCPNSECGYYLPFDVGVCPYCGENTTPIKPPKEPRDWRLKERLSNFGKKFSKGTKKVITTVEKVVKTIFKSISMGIYGIIAAIFTYIAMFVLFPLQVYSAIWFIREWANERDYSQPLRYWVYALTGGFWYWPEYEKKDSYYGGTEAYLDEEGIVMFTVFSWGIVAISLAFHFFW